MLKLILIIKFHQFNCRLLMHMISQQKKILVEEMTLSLSQIVDDITILAIFFSVSHRISLTNTSNSRKKKPSHNIHHSHINTFLIIHSALITCLRFCSVHLINFHFALLFNSRIYFLFLSKFY